MLDVTVRTGPNDNILEFSYFTKGGHKDVFKADDGNGDAWVLKICDERYDAIEDELRVQNAMAGDVLQHIATSHVVLADRRMHIALQRRAQCTVEEAISDLLPMLAKDPNTFVDDVFEVMRVVLDMQIRLTRRNIHIKDGGLQNLGFMGKIEKARLKTCSRTPWIDFEHCRVLPRESKPRRKHVNQVVVSMLGGVCVSLSPDTLGAKLAGPLQCYGSRTWQELSGHLIYYSPDLDWIQQYLRELKKSF